MIAFQPELPPRAAMIAAMLASDSAYEGVFFTAVRTTGIFCRPSCTARKPKPDNVEFFAAADDALVAGYRPCKRCRPLGPAAAAPDWLAPLLAAVDAQPARRWSEHDLDAFGLEPARLRAWFKAHYGMTFFAWLRSRRLGAALNRLQQGDPIDAAAVDHGYESISGFRSAFQKRFAITPGRGGAVRQLIFKRILTPLGPMLAMAEAQGLVLLEFVDRPALTAELETLRERHGYLASPGDHPHLQQTERELGQYFGGTRQRFDVPLCTPGSQFERAVWRRLQEIPFGTTQTYGALAAALGRPAAARAVGTANGANRIAILVPCHRIVGADGDLVGYGGGKPRKAFLLRLEREVVAMQGMRQAQARPDHR